VTAAKTAAPHRPVLARLAYIEGLRGLAALGVCLHHLVYVVPGMPPNSPDGELGPSWFRLLVRPLLYGNELVALFLLVSGFSLYYSEHARRSRGKPGTTLSQFARRRLWRILPVYYVALAFGLAVTLVLRQTGVSTGQGDPTGVTAGGVLSHLFLVHNWTEDWAFQANGPLWSIAYEMQVYLLFPVMLLLARRTNVWLGVGVVAVPLTAVGYLELPHPVFGLLVWFAAGMLLAHVCTSARRLPSGELLAGVGVAALLLGVANQLAGAVAHDVVWGVAFGCLVTAGYVGCRLSPLMEAGPVRWLGERSYSLYALHYPLMLLVLAGAQQLGLAGMQPLAPLLAVALPLSLLAAHVTYRLVEVPSMRRVRLVGATGAVAEAAGDRQAAQAFVPQQRRRLPLSGGSRPSAQRR
jgi:peptidoglycan/LPS O-acetylase OafA/YrhL